MDPLTQVRIIQATAVINLVLFLAVASSCRFVPGLSLGKRLMRTRGYKRFYKYHTYLWWAFLPSIIVHAVFAFRYLNP